MNTRHFKRAALGCAVLALQCAAPWASPEEGAASEPAASGTPTHEPSRNLPILDFDAQIYPIIGTDGMVVTQDRLAALAGAQILTTGGNAVDAAVATAFALAVTHPQAGNLGGGGFMLIHLVAPIRTIAIDYREMAPKRATRDMFLNAAGDVDTNKALFSLAGAGVPGTVMGLTEVQRRYGSRPLATVMAPAIQLAQRGFIIDYPLAEALRRSGEHLARDPAARRIFFHPNGTPLSAGERLVQHDLARTLRRIAQGGAADFYTGTTAHLIVAAMQRGDGLISTADLGAYRAIERPPLLGTYHDRHIATFPPPSSGGVHVIQMLNILEGYDLKALGLNSAAYLHRLIEAMRSAYADRSKFLGDSDYVNVPVSTLISKAYAAAIRTQIPLDHARRSADVAPARELPDESPQTTHFSVVDRAGNAVSNTFTLNFTFGSGHVVEGGGFLLNNEMDDFSSKPGTPNAFGLIGGAANAIGPGKRPLSSMTPLMVFDPDGRLLLVTGSPGGSTIITTVLQEVLNILEFHLNSAQATVTPRIHHQWFPDIVVAEPGISRDTLDLLRGMGHVLAEASDKPNSMPKILGVTETIVSQNGALLGWADGRDPGATAVPVNHINVSPIRRDGAGEPAKGAIMRADARVIEAETTRRN
jgi:gamma-glutamyltranspeptidase/glutathione hydrolase